MLKLSEYAGTYKLASEKGFIIASLDLNGKGIKEWLEKQGIKCIENYDTGRNGLVITEDGHRISTNGYCSMEV